jgi:pilus assembly protein CpaF
LGQVVAEGLGDAVDVTRRLAERLVRSTVAMDRAALTREAEALLPEEAPLGGTHLARRAVDAVLGLGELEDLLRDPAVSDVLVNGSGEVWVERSGSLERCGVDFGGSAVRAAVERVVAPLGLRLDRASPSVDARLPDGSRLHASIPPVSVDGPILAIRRFTAAVPDLDAMVDIGGISEAGADLLRSRVIDRANLLIAGSTGAGKTTLLNVLLREVPASERVITVEDAAELQPSGHMVRLESRPPNSEGAGEIDLASLVRRALRLRPDRIVVGEVRGPEALDMVLAMSTGHQGSMSTVHAGSAVEALWRVATLALSGPRPPEQDSIDEQLRAAIDLVVVVARAADGRRVQSISEVTADGIEEVYACC